MDRTRFTLLALATLGSLFVGIGTARADAIDDLQPGHWLEVPSSHLDALDPCPSSDCSWSAVEGVDAVMNDWSGGAFDTFRDRLIVWGGGHGGYAGNEIYVFSLSTLSWERVSEPCDPPNKDAEYAPDGTPTSRHTYNYVQYVPAPVDRFCSFGGAGFYENGQTGTHHVDCFDFGTNAWETQKFSDTLAQNLIGSISAVDPATGKVWQHGGNQGFLIDLDPPQNSWTAHGDQFNGTYVDYYKTADIDPGRKLMVAVGNGEIWTWDIGASGDIPGVALTTTGGDEIVSANSPGFAYDPEIDQFVAWNGGADVFTLDLDTSTWTKHSAAADNTVVPTAPNGNGTFGRFRYSPARNVFVAVNAVNESVYVYRLSPGGGPAVDAGTGGSGAGGSASGGASSGGSGGNGTGGGSSGSSGTSATPGENASSDDGGCGCRTTGTQSNAPFGGLLVVLALLGQRFVARRRGLVAASAGARFANHS